MAVKSCGEYEQHPYYLKCVHHHSFISEKPLGFFLWIAPNPTFCVPSQFVSWSAHPLEPPSETYVSALHDMWSTKARKLSMALSVNWTSFVAKSLVQLVTHSCLKSVKPFHDIPDKKLFAADSMQALESNPILCFTADAIIPYGSRFFLVEVDSVCFCKGW